MEKIIFDTDPGIDDAMALLLIHSLNALDVVGITTVFGNASIDTCTRNALYMCERFDLSYPVYRGAGRTIEGEDESDFPDFVHGKNGLGDIEIGLVHLQEQQCDAASFIIEASKQTSDLSVLAVGRMTNVAAALTQDPDLARRLHRVVIMGGAVSVPGNVSEWAEANIFGDPEAADIVFQSGVKVDLVPLDATLINLVTRDELKRLAEKLGDAGQFLWQIKQHYLGFYSTKGQGDVFPMHDSSAAVAMVDDGLFSWRSGELSCVLDGEQRGRTVLNETAAGPHRVALSADREKSWGFVSDALLSAFLS